MFHGMVQDLQEELIIEDRESFRRFLRLTPEFFTLLAEIFRTSIGKQGTFMEAWHFLPKTDKFFFFFH